MPNTALIPALAKTLIAVAWADGSLHPEEEATLKEVLGLLPEMSAAEWALIEMYLVLPIMPDERAELTEIAQNLIRSASDQAIALEAVDRMLHADDLVDPQEEAAAHSVHEAFEAVDVSLLGRVGRMMGGAFSRKPSREAAFELWRSNPVAYYARARARPNAPAPSDTIFDTAALAAGIMAQVVRVTPASAEQERPVLAQALETDWGVTSEQAQQLADAALAVTHRDVDFHRISRGLVQRTSESERVLLLDTLFTIANTAERVDPAEIDTIRVIADRLNLTRQQFIAAKLKIASEDRGGL